MICRCFGRTFDVSRPAAAAFGQRARAVAEVVMGLGDYDAYVAHMGKNHPGDETLTREGFFRAREAARYGAGGMRCC